MGCCWDGRWEVKAGEQPEEEGESGDVEVALGAEEAHVDDGVGVGARVELGLQVHVHLPVLLHLHHRPHILPLSSGYLLEEEVADLADGVDEEEEEGAGAREGVHLGVVGDEPAQAAVEDLLPPSIPPPYRPYPPCRVGEEVGGGVHSRADPWEEKDGTDGDLNVQEHRDHRPLERHGCPRHFYSQQHRSHCQIKPGSHCEKIGICQLSLRHQVRDLDQKFIGRRFNAVAKLYSGFE